MKAIAIAIACGAWPRLAKLDLVCAGITDRHLEAFCDGLITKGLPNLRSLNLNYNRITDKGVIALADAMKPVTRGGKGAMAQLKELYLIDNPIGDDGYQFLEEALRNGTLPSGLKCYMKPQNRHGYSSYVIQL